MMATQLDFALLSWAAYSDNKLPDENEWKVAKTFENTKTGFAASAFWNENTGEMVIAYRGTDGFRDWTNANIQVWVPQLKHYIPDQYKDALNFYNDIKAEYKNSNISITGHSLGGILAQLVGAKTLAQTVTFNSIGVEHLLDNLDPPLSKSMNYSNITNYSLENDLLYLIHKKGEYNFLGNSYVIPSTYQNPIEAHKSIFAACSGTPYESSEWAKLKNNSIPAEVNDTFTEADNTRPFIYDPLLLDLDGDGIETTTAANGVFFAGAYAKIA